MDTRCRIHKRERGATAIQILVIMVPVVFAFLGFAIDLGILYSMKGELKSGANAMALAAADQLLGTDASAGAATLAAQATVETASGFGNKYYFDGRPIGANSGTLVSTVTGPNFYASLADALASNASTGSEAGGADGRHVRVTLTGQTQLLFWSFIPIVSDRTVSVAATAVAGISPPLCEACAIEPYAVAAVNPSDTTDFGFVPGTQYSFTFYCTGTQPGLLPESSVELPYLLLNRLDPNAVVFPDEASQIFRDAAGGLPGSTNTALACFEVGNTEVIWASAIPEACFPSAVPAVVTEALCGLDTRFESTPQSVCDGIPGIDTLATIYPPDTDVNEYDTYTDYAGDGRRILTIPIVDALNPSSTMTVLGFRQFLLMPAEGAVDLNAADTFGRFVAMYIGSVAPVKQGRFDGCEQSAGPGKVVLQQ
ncbi:MAG TPA: hypothetical protein VK419_07965 [Bryobacteraceae bacterium]|nr:hypothetical protein [Bryobacteraceae bacterium]